jgi:hypothetical protein
MRGSNELTQMDESLRPGGVDNPPPLINPFHLIATIIKFITSRTVSKRRH